MRKGLIIAAAFLLSLMALKMKLETAGRKSVSNPAATSTPEPSHAPQPDTKESPISAEPVSTDPPIDQRGEVAGSPQVMNLTARAREALPHLSQLKGRTSEEVHFAPPEVHAAGSALGELAEHLRAHPEDIPAALPFYLDCAADPQGLPAVRALCYGNLIRRQAYWSDQTRSGVKNIPEEIRDLWRNLED